MPRNFDNWLVEYMQYTSGSEAPDLFHFWTGVSTLAAVLQRKVWIDERIFQWTPNFYIVFVGPPGIVTKSTTIGVGLDLLEEIPGVRIGPSSMTWQGLTDALAEAFVEVPMDDAYYPMACVTCSVGELGTFLRPQDRELVDVLTALWDGQKVPWRRRTSAKGEKIIANPWINVIAATTPAWLRDNVPDAMIGGGLTSRIVFVYGEEKRKFLAYPSDAVSETDFERQRQLLIEDLCHIAEIKGEYKLTEDAKAWGRSWYEKHWSTRPAHMASDRFSGYIARKQTHIHKLAIVLAAAQRSDLTIDKRDLTIANDMMTGLEADMHKVFESIGVAEETKAVREILTIVKAFNGVPKIELWRHCMTMMSAKEFDEAVEAAVRANYLKIVTTQQGIMYYYREDSNEAV